MYETQFHCQVIAGLAAIAFYQVGTKISGDYIDLHVSALRENCGRRKDCASDSTPDLSATPFLAGFVLHRRMLSTEETG
jgi:hypothetical protein